MRYGATGGLISVTVDRSRTRTQILTRIVPKQPESAPKSEPQDARLKAGSSLKARRASRAAAGGSDATPGEGAAGEGGAGDGPKEGPLGICEALSYGIDMVVQGEDQAAAWGGLESGSEQDATSLRGSTMTIDHLTEEGVDIGAERLSTPTMSKDGEGGRGSPSAGEPVAAPGGPSRARSDSMDPCRVPEADDFRRVAQLSLELEGQEYLFEAHAPFVFQSIRRRFFMMEDEEYVQTMCREPLKMVGEGEGKSGCYFMFSKDQVSLGALHPSFASPQYPRPRPRPRSHSHSHSRPHSHPRPTLASHHQKRAQVRVPVSGAYFDGLLRAHRGQHVPLAPPALPRPLQNQAAQPSC